MKCVIWSIIAAFFAVYGYAYFSQVPYDAPTHMITSPPANSKNDGTMSPEGDGGIDTITMFIILAS